jgi:hypothetical protein
VNIELKYVVDPSRSVSLSNCRSLLHRVGYGFVVSLMTRLSVQDWFNADYDQEFESREAAEESVAKYHEGYFMGNKIRVELSHGGGRTAKYSGDPGACFKCGEVGHWAR